MPGGRVYDLFEPPSRPARADGLPVYLRCAALAGITASILCVLSAVYASLAPSLRVVFDVWFGADSPRYIVYAEGLSVASRAHWHPFVWVLYKVLGVPLAVLGVAKSSMPLPYFALPSILTVSAVATVAAQVVVAGTKRLAYIPLAVAVTLLLGSALVFGPVPESHIVGGGGLLLLGLMQIGISGNESGRSGHWALVPVAALAVGASLSNAVAVLLQVSVSPVLRDSIAKRRKLAVATTLLLAAVTLTIWSLERRQDASFSPLTALSHESAYIGAPGLPDFAFVCEKLVVNQFGVPQTAVCGTSLQTKPTIEPLQVAALLFWVVGILCTACGTVKRNSRWATALASWLLAYVALLLFHSFYDAQEAFLFSGHAWPFVVLPALLAFKGALTSRAVRLACWFHLASVALSAVQTAVSFPVFLENMRRLPGAW